MKTISNKIFIVMPAFNEEGNIGRVLRTLKKEGYKNIVVVDDGSRDHTARKAEEQGVVVLKHFINRGPGAATQTGLSFAKEQGADFAVTIDADAQHNPEDIRKLLEESNKGKYDIIFGSRFLKNSSQVPLKKRFFNKIADLITFLLSTKWVTDSQTGFKVFSRKALEKINITTNGFEFCTEIFMQIRVHNLSFKEIPITVSYHKESQKKGQNFATGITTLFKLFIEAITK